MGITLLTGATVTLHRTTLPFLRLTVQPDEHRGLQPLEYHLILLSGSGLRPSHNRGGLEIELPGKFGHLIAERFAEFWMFL